MAAKPHFTKGRKYRVKRAYAFLNHTFSSGEVVTFHTSAYDAKGGVTRYWFGKTDSDETNVWHVFDNPRAEDLTADDVFEAL
jgi:hypothetical protein